jgi:hypothetical protein
MTAMLAQEIVLQVSENILSVTVLIIMAVSVFLSIIYSLVFVLQPYDPEREQEKDPLMDGFKASPSDGSRAAASPQSDKNENISAYLQMAVLALLYALITGIRLNSIKVLLQLSWPAGQDETPEVIFCLFISRFTS